MFGWWRRYRRRRILSRPFPDEWRVWLQSNVLLYSRLNAQHRVRLESLTQMFVAEKTWEGLQGQEVTAEMRVTIAGQACLLLLGLPGEWCFDHVLSVLIYPKMYIANETTVTRAGVVVEGRDARLGEAWYRGPVILSWRDSLAGGRRETPGRNLVLHEFAHQLDMLNGPLPDGVPPVGGKAEFREWSRVMKSAFDELVACCRRGQHGVLDCYGATDPAEFFSVATESFFEEPHAMQADVPDVFEAFLKFYQVDPCEWHDSDW